MGRKLLLKPCIQGREDLILFLLLDAAYCVISCSCPFWGCWSAMYCKWCSPWVCSLPAQPYWEWGEVNLELIAMAEKLLGAFPTLIFSEEKKARCLRQTSSVWHVCIAYELVPLPFAFVKLMNDFWEDIGVPFRLSLWTAVQNLFYTALSSFLWGSCFHSLKGFLFKGPGSWLRSIHFPTIWVCLHSAVQLWTPAPSQLLTHTYIHTGKKSVHQLGPNLIQCSACDLTLFKSS